MSEKASVTVSNWIKKVDSQEPVARTERYVAFELEEDQSTTVYLCPRKFGERGKTTIQADTSSFVVKVFLSGWTPTPLTVPTTEQVRIWLEQDREVLVHEFVHLFDFKRIGNTEIIKRLCKTRDSSSESYFNNPLEFHAFLVQGVWKTGAVDDSEFKTWYKTATKNMDKEFLMFLTPTSRKKLVKRLYQTWQNNLDGRQQPQCLKLANCTHTIHTPTGSTDVFSK